MYGEIIIGLNMLFNYAILTFANKVGNVGVNRRRLLYASFVGAVPVTFFPSSAVAVIASFLGMTVCAFGRAFGPWKKSAGIVLIGAVFAGGLLTAFQYRIHTPNGKVSILLYAVIAYSSLYFMRKKWLDVRITRSVSELNATSTLCVWGQDIPVKVFVDTGNSCTEPLSGAPVHFVSTKVLEGFIPEELKEPLFSWDPLGPAKLTQFPEAYLKDIRLVKLVTVQGNSWAVAFKFEEWKIEGGTALEQGYIVLTKEDRRYPDGAGAILHVSAMETISKKGGAVHAA